MINILRLCAIACLISMAGSTAVFAGSEKVDIDRVGGVYLLRYPAGRIETYGKGGSIVLPNTNPATHQPASPSFLRGDVCVTGIDTNGTQDFGTLSIFNNNLYVTFHDSRAPVYYPDIYFAKSTDGGQSFGSKVLVNSDTPYNQDYARSVVGLTGTIYVCWESDNTAGRDYDILFAKSTNGGLSFTPGVSVNNIRTDEQQYPAIAVSPTNGYIYIVYESSQTAGNGTDIYFARSTNGGTNFENAIRVNDIALTEDQWEPIIAVGSTGTIYVAWFDQPADDEIRFARSTNNGSSFGSSVRVNSIPPDNAWLPSGIAASGASNVYITWPSFGAAPYPVYLNRSTDGGLTWGPNVNMRDVTTWAGGSPDVSVGQDGAIYAAWIDYRGGNWDCYFAKSTDGGVSFGANSMLNVVTTGDQGTYPTIREVGARGVVCCVGADTRYASSRDMYLYSNGIIGIAESEVNNSVSGIVFKPRPNPFALWTAVPGYENVRVLAYDISGRQVGSYSGKQVGMDLRPGVYFIKPEGKDVLPGRVVKIR